MTISKKIFLFIAGPGGSGKGTLEKKLDQEKFTKVVSHTSREKRPGEINGSDYYFCKNNEAINEIKGITEITNPSFSQVYKLSESEFLEHKNENILYDVNEVKYIADVINWMKENGFYEEFEFKILLTKHSVSLDEVKENMLKRDPEKGANEFNVRTRPDLEDNLSACEKYGLTPDWHFKIFEEKQDENDIKEMNNFLNWQNSLRYNIDLLK